MELKAYPRPYKSPIPLLSFAIFLLASLFTHFN